MSLLVKRVGIPFGGTQHRNISGINDDSPERVKIDFLVLLTAYFISVRPLLDILRDTYVGPVTGTFAAGLAIVVCGTFALLARAIVIQGHPVTHLVLGYAAWSVISGTVAIIWLDAGDFVSALLRLLIVLVGYLSFFELGIKRPDVVPKLLALPAVPACLLALIQLHLNIGLPRSEWVSEQELNRVLGPFEHPNALAIYGAVILALAVGTIVSSDWRGNSSKAWALLAGLCVLAIIPTYARIVWLSIPVALVLMGIVSRRLMLPLGILLLGGVAAVILWRQQIETRLSGYSSLSYRRSLWVGLIERMEWSNFITGRGFGQVNSLVAATTGHLGDTAVIQVHNDYLRVLIEGGVLGFALYFGAIVAALVVAWRGVREVKHDLISRQLCCATVGASVAVLVISLSDNIVGIPVLQLIYWSLVGGAMGSLMRAENSKFRDSSVATG